MLDGTADANAAVALHVHSDDVDAVPRWLDEHGVPAQSRSRHLRLEEHDAQQTRTGCPDGVARPGDRDIDAPGRAVHLLHERGVDAALPHEANSGDVYARLLA